MAPADGQLASFTDTLQGLVDAETAPTAAGVPGLSNPSPADLAAWKATLARVKVDRRRELAGALLESAQDSFQVNYKPLFEALLDDADGTVRSAAIDGLWEAEDLYLLDRFTELATHDLDAGVRAHAATALGNFLCLAELEEIPAKRIEPALRVVLERAQDESEDLDVRRRAIASAGYADRPEVRVLIDDALDSDEPELIAGALRAIGNSADETWGPQLVAWLEVEDPFFTREAVWAAGELAWEPAVTQLAFLSDTDDRQLLADVIRALGEIGGKNAARVMARIGPRVAEVEDLSEIFEDAMANLALNDGTIGFDRFTSAGKDGGPGRGRSGGSVDEDEEDLVAIDGRLVVDDDFELDDDEDDDEDDDYEDWIIDDDSDLVGDEDDDLDGEDADYLTLALGEAEIVLDEEVDLPIELDAWLRAAGLDDDEEADGGGKSA